MPYPSSPDQMYDVHYLQDIMKTEAKRPLVESKRHLQLIDYSLAQAWLDLCHLSSSPFTSVSSLEELMVRCGQVNNQLVSATLKLNFSDPKISSLFAAITNYLSLEKPTTSADLIFVMTSKSLSRMNKAIELYRQKVAPLIFICGGHPFYEPYNPSEAQVYYDYAVKQGISSSSLLIEPQSVSVADYVRRGLNFLDDHQIKFTRLVFIIGWFAQKRAWMMLEKYLFDTQTSFYVAPQLESTSPIHLQKWFTNEFGIKIIINEFLKMSIHDYLVFNNYI